MTDLVLAIAHHLLVFMLFAVFAIEYAVVRPGLTQANARRIARLDGMYGGLALLVILVGLGRVFHGLRGWEYYVYYWAFWAKMASFAAVGLLTVPVTRCFRKWSRGGEGLVPESEIAEVRPWLVRQALVFPLIPIFAAIMARGLFY